MKIFGYLVLSVLIMIVGCVDSHPFITGYIKKAEDGLLTTCDPYNKGVQRSCVIYAPTFGDALVIYNASDKEMVLAPNPYFPLLVPISKGTHALAEAKTDGNDDKVEFFFALNGSQKKLYVIRKQPDDKKSKESFQKPLEHEIPTAAYKIAGYYYGDHYFVLMTHPDAGQVGILALNSDGSLVLNGYRAINVGVRPSHIAIDASKAVAVMSDEGSPQLSIVSLSDILAVAQGKKAPTPARVIPIGMNSEKLSLSHRDLGNGFNLYAIASEMAGKKIVLIDISNSLSVAQISASDHVTALYLPSENNDVCCNKKEHWFQYTTAKGQLYFAVVSTSGATFSLEEKEPVELSSKDNIGVNNVRVNAIVGGRILKGSKKADNKECRRKVFYLTSFAANKIDGRQIEAQAYSCEGEEGAYLMGDEAGDRKDKKRSLLRE